MANPLEEERRECPVPGPMGDRGSWRENINEKGAWSANGGGVEANMAD